jgi:hypothetical protein
MNARIVVTAAGVVAGAVLAFGGVSMSAQMNTSVRAASAGSVATDARLARTTLANQLAWLRRTGSWRRIASTGSVKCGPDASGALDRTGTADSGTLRHNTDLQISFQDFVYSDKNAATRAFGSLASQEEEACLAKVLVSLERRRFHVGKAELIVPESVRAGDEGRAAEIIIPITSNGRRSHLYHYIVDTRDGRVIVATNTDSNSSIFLPWDVKVARGMAEIVSWTRAPHRKSTSGTSTTNQTRPPSDERTSRMPPARSRP